MSNQFVVAQAGFTSPSSSAAPVQIIKVIKPQAGHTEIFHAIFDGTVKIDFTAIAGEKFTLFHDNKNESLHVIFADDSQVIIEPFFDSMGIMSNLVFEMSLGQVLNSVDFASQFPVTTDQSVMPPGVKEPLASGADFSDPSVDSLSPNKPALRPLEELPPLVFHDLPPISAAGLPPAPPPQSTLPSPPAANGGDFSGSVLEAGGVNNGTPGVPIATGDLNSSDVDNPNEAWTVVGSRTASASGYGSYTLTAFGVWTYTLDNSNASVQALNVGQTLTDTFTAFTVDGTAQLVTITINGANDAAVITGVASGSVTEAGGVANGTPGTPIATGNLNSTDVDNPSDIWIAVGTATASSNGYGTYALTASGLWAYTLDNSNPAVQALNVGQTLTDTFTATTIDGTAQLVTVTINGANDAAVISGATSGSVTEAGGVNNGTPGTPVATGDLNSTDVDNLSDTWTVVGSPTASASGFGSYTLTAAGVWNYTLNNSNAAVQALNVGDTLTDTFTATTVDGTVQLVTVTINGANDAAVITGVASGSVTEAGGVANGTPGTPIATGNLNSTDVDNPSDIWIAVGTATVSTNGYGTYALTASGLWAYTLDNSNPVVQALNVGQTLTDTFTAFTIDGTAQLVTVTINGANDAAVITGPVTGTVVEAGGVNNGTPGVPIATGDLNSSDVDNPNEAWTVVGSPTASASGYGSYTLTAAGVWTYTLDNSNASVQALNVGETLTDTFTATTVDGAAELVTVTIDGANDAAVITGVASGSVTEAGGVANGTPGTPIATGNLNSTDVDNPSDIWIAVGTATASTNGYGTYALTASGLWAYTLDNSNPAVQALNVGQTLTDTFTAFTIDGTVQPVTITINGANDAAVISGPVTGTVVEASGVNNGTPGSPVATGDLNAADVDNLSDTWTVVGSPTASTSGYGSYTLTAAGVWTYTLDDTNAVVQALNVGQTLTDTFTATTVDGTAQLVTITIDGANDAAVITGVASGSVTEAGGVGSGMPGTPIATGDLTSTEVDNPPDEWMAVSAPTASAFGTYTLTAGGAWTYRLDNSNPAVQALNAGDTLTDTFTATTIDGTPQLVTITIHGTDDAAVISGDFTGTVLEAGGVANGTPGIPTATGDLDAANVGNPLDWMAVSSPTASTEGYGTYTLTTTGAWTYTLDDSNAAVQALNVGQTLTDTFTAITVDGTAQLVTITIDGANDTAVITGDTTGSVVEAGGVANGTPGTSFVVGNLDAADVDNTSDSWTAIETPTLSSNGYGTFTIDAAGQWIYILDDDNTTVQALNVGQTLTDTFTAITVDGTAQLVTITINGANDAAVISGATNGSVTEAGGVNNGTPGTPTATGDLNSTDVDNPNDSWTVVGSSTASDNGYGSYTLTTAGVWTYTLNNSNAAVQALNVGDILTDHFTITTIDGTARLVIVTINGANDAAVITGDPTGSVFEAGGVANGTPGVPIATGHLNSTDVDNLDDAWDGVSTSLRGDSSLGTYTLTATGVWTYTLDNSNPAVQALNAGQTLTDTFTAFTIDGTAQLVTITINGANDTAVISGATSGSVLEAGGVANGTPGTPTATGDLNSTDVDNPNDTWAVVGSPTASTTGFGSYTLTAGGVWTYTLNNSNPAVQALNVGDTLTDTFTATTIDGTAQLVTVTINGANDAAVITGVASGSVTEAGGVANGTPGVQIATGHLNSTDVDNPNDAWDAVGIPLPGDSSLGSYTLSPGGAWTYTLDNSNPAVQALNAGQTLTDTFTAFTIDGTAQLVTITINGANDTAVISGATSGSVLEAGGVANGTPGTPTATGDLNSTDVDNLSDTWTVVGSPTASTSGFGSYTLTTAGVWTYTLNNSNPAVQALNVGDTLTDTFTATTVDGTAQLVTVTIEGANDAAVITGVASGSVTEAGGVANGTPGIPIATGDLTSTEVDNPPDFWDAVGIPLRGDSSLGSYTLSPGGAWTYTLDNSNPAVQALNAGQTLTDTFTTFTIDGTAQLVTITINGANDTAVISGATSGSVLEAGGVANGTPGTPVATGDLKSTDVDNLSETWTVVGSPTASTSGFGSYTLTTAGVWTYTLNNSNPAVQALNVGDTLTDTFTATTVDGTAQLVTVTIEGANDAAVITGVASGSVTEAGGVANGTPGIPIATGDLTSTEVDNPPDEWTAVSAPTASGFGSYTLTAGGAWTYTLNNSNPTVQALNVGQTLTDTFTATTVDGTAQQVSVTINGTNDAAVISGPVTGTVVEASGVANGTPGTPVATGDLNSTDVDNLSDTWTVVGSPTASTSGFGSYTLTTAGVWTYTLNNSNPAVQALNVGDTLTDTFTATTVDGTAQLVTITINGANDAALITGDTTGSVIEAGGVGSGTPGAPIATGDLTSTEVDNPPDEWTAVSAPTASGFGSYTLTAGGAWTYTLNNSNPTVQALNVGQTLTDTFTATTVDGTPQQVTITIHGTDDAAVIGGDFTGTVLEAGGFNNGTPGIPTATGDLDAANIGNPLDWTPVDTPTTGDNGYGSYTLTTAGLWAYTLDNSNAAVQALNVGQTLTDTFTAKTVDGTSQVVTITINGANDTAAITGDITGSVLEASGVANGTPGVPIARGHLNSTDVDNPNNLWEPDGTPLRGDSGFSTYTVTSTGDWTYTLDNSNPTVQALNVGQTLTDTLTAITIDGTPQLVTITINGANDAAVITGATSGSVLEAGGVNNGTPGTPTATGDLNSTDVDNPNDTWTAVGSPIASTSGFGSYTLTTAGLWAYTLDNSNAAVQALNVGQTLTDAFTAKTVDGTSQVVTITINGANDTAAITGDITGSVLEAGGVANGTPGVPIARGHLNSTDVDNPNNLWEPDGTPLRGDSGFSTYTVTSTGDWTYTLDNSNPTVQALNVGQTLTDTLTAITIDGTPQLVTITINGANDAAVITGATSGSVLEAGGVNNGTPGTPTATGDLNSTDVDNPNDTWTAVGSPIASTSGFGSYTLTTAGLWAYTLDNSNAAVQALNVGQTLTDAFTAKTVDGTSQVVTITINGANDTAAITGDITGSVLEAGGVANGTPGVPIARGHLNSTDVDNPNNLWEPDGTPLRGDSGFSTYTVTSTGDWTYTLDNSNPTVQALNVGQTLTDTLTAITIDGTPQLVTITINGANDAAVITGATSGSVLEAGGVNNGTPGTPTATGDLNSTDVDNPNDTWTAVGSPIASTSGFGSYTLTTAGLWAYTLDNSNAAVQALNVGQTLTDTFTAKTVDGTSQVVTITINGANDTAAITGDITGSVLEAGGVANGTPGVPIATGNLNSTDVDSPNDLWQPVGPLRGDTSFGTYTVTSAGVWTYTLDNSNPTVQALNVGQTMTDTFTAFTIDGTAQLVTVTINGANDAAVITGPVTGTVVEAGEVNNGSLGTPTATGDLNAADVDNANDAWTAVSSPAASASGFGSFTLTAAGAWTYTLNNSNAAVQALNVGDTLIDAFTVTTIDGTAKVVTITINGSNDTPVAVPDNNAGDPVTESGVNPGNTPFAGDSSAAGNVLANDLDVDSGDTKTVVAVNGESLNVGQPLVGTYGTLTLLANGTWSYALNNADPDTNALAHGQVATDVFTYTMSDASGATSASSLTIAITGTNDAPDIIILSGDHATANLTETDAGLTTNGTITVRDPDLTDTVTASVTAVALSGTTGGLGAADVLGMLSVTPGLIAADPGDTNNLAWAFNSGAQAFNFLNSGDTLTLAYTVQAIDGSASDVQTVTVTITGAGPVANGDNILVSNSTTVIIPWSALLANDSDPQATITGVTNLNGVTGGTIPVTLDSTTETIAFTTPNTSDLTGNTFTYTVSDALGTSTATVNVGVMQFNTSGKDTADLSAQTYDFSYMFTDGGNDTFTGGPGTDHFFGGGGNDTYKFAFTGGGNDLIDESILGGGGNDVIQIATPVGASFTDLNFQRVDADSDGSVDDLHITYNGQSITVINEFDGTAAHQIETMSFNGGDFGGYSLGTGPYTINATTGGNDIVAGTGGNDSLNGGSGGNDLIFAGAGNDTIDGGNGNDLLVGGTGNDTLFGGGGNDTYLFALNDGIDTINENGGLTRGPGTDQIVIAANGAALSSLNFFDTVAGAGGDLVIDYNGQQITVINEFAGNNNSTVETLTFFGGASYLGYDLGSAAYNLTGINSIEAGDSEANTLSGSLGRDLIFGNAGNDTINGGGGSDLLVGGDGNDSVTGGLGDDVVVGGNGNDTLTGGGGNDKFAYLATTDGQDIITDFNSDDELDFSHTAFGNLPVGILNPSNFETDTTHPSGTTNGTLPSGTPEFIFNTGNKTLYYDADGSGANAAIAMAQLENGHVVVNTEIHIT